MKVERKHPEVDGVDREGDGGGGVGEVVRVGGVGGARHSWLHHCQGKQPISSNDTFQSINIKKR